MCREYEDARLTPVYSKEEIAGVVQRLADEIARDYASRKLSLLVVLSGAFIFAADLARRLKSPLEVDFIKLASYNGQETSGCVKISEDVETQLTGKNVLVLEDIVDTGITLEFLLRHLASRRPTSLKVCALIDKRERRRTDVTVDYAGFVCNNRFLVGYGLDLDGRYRELDAIYTIADLPACGGLNDNSM